MTPGGSAVGADLGKGSLNGGLFSSAHLTGSLPLS